MSRPFLFKAIILLTVLPAAYAIFCGLLFCAKRDLAAVAFLKGGQTQTSLILPVANTSPQWTQVVDAYNSVPSLKIMSYNLNHVSRGNDNDPANSPYFPPGSPEWEKIGRTIYALLEDPQRLDRNLGQIIAQIKKEDPDIVFLQEVDRGVLESLNRDTAQELVQGTGFPYAVWGSKWSMDLGIRHITGNAILSKYPIVAAENVPLNPIDGVYAYRRLVGVHTALVANIQFGDQKIDLINSHLYSKKYGYDKKIEQVVNLLGLVENSANPVIFGGDINSSIKRLRSGRPCSKDPSLPLLYQSGLVARAGFFDEDTLDYIFVRPGDPTYYLEQYKLPPVATDHHIIISIIGLYPSEDTVHGHS